MAGKRHHFIPRFLQKGFASRVKSNEIYTWVFSRGKEPYETNIQNIGLEKDFYGEQEENTVDNDITQKEQDFISFLDKLRAQTADAPVDSDIISSFIVHLLVRTKNIRSTMQDAGSSIIDIFRRNLSDAKSLQSLILNYLRENPDEFKQMMQLELGKAGVTITDSRVLDTLYDKALNEAPEFVQSNLSNPLFPLHAAFNLVQNRMNTVARNAQLKALSRDLDASPFIEKIHNFNWMLFVRPRNSFILGDIGPVTITRPGGEFKSLFFAAREDLEAIFLPLSDRHLIIGSNGKKIDQIDIETLNIASASLSTDFFIGGAVTNREISYLKILGSTAFPFSGELKDFESFLKNNILGDNQ